MGITCPKGNKRGRKHPVTQCLIHKCRKIRYCYAFSMATRYLRISVNTKLQLQMKPAKVRCCFIADMKKIDGKVVFYTTELVRYLYCLNLRSRTRYLNPSLHTPQRARTCLLVGHSPPLYLRKHLNMRLKINNIAKIRVKLVMNAK